MNRNTQELTSTDMQQILVHLEKLRLSGAFAEKFKRGTNLRKSLKRDPKSTNSVLHELWRFRRFMERKFASVDS
jgi:hypothetical protein